MLTVSEAIAALVTEVRRLPAAHASLGEALGHVLAENVVSDLESPPFAKALMDGFAPRSAHPAKGRASCRQGVWSARRRPAAWRNKGKRWLPSTLVRGSPCWRQETSSCR